jgi:hypothetical protein
VFRDAKCLTHGRPAKVYRLKYPQPESAPSVMRWEAPGPALFMCDECAAGAGEWAAVETPEQLANRVADAAAFWERRTSRG